jgi:hypothetical protein
MCKKNWQGYYERAQEILYIRLAHRKKDFTSLDRDLSVFRLMEVLTNR